MHDERARTHLRCELTDVQAATRTEQPDRGLGSAGTPQQILIPGHLLRCAVRHEQHAEHPAERRIRRRPARPDRGDDGVFLLVLTAESSSARIPAVEDQVGDAVGMACRVRNRDSCSLGDTKQRKSLQAHCVDDRLADHRPTRRRTARRYPCPRTRSLARHIGSRVCRSPSRSQPVAPHRTLPIELQMSEPGGDSDKRKPLPCTA